MAGFDADYSEIKDMNVADGTYEAVINNMSEDATKSGAEFMNVDLIIRNDIQAQKFGDAHVFTRIFKSKETHKYPIGMIMQLSKAAGFPDHTHFDSFDDYMAKLWHKPVQIKVKNETSEYQGKQYENLNVKAWGVSKFPDVQHKFKASKQDQINAASDQASEAMDHIDISDDDLPF